MSAYYENEFEEMQMQVGRFVKFKPLYRQAPYGAYTYLISHLELLNNKKHKIVKVSCGGDAVSLEGIDLIDIYKNRLILIPSCGEKEEIE